MTDLVIIGIVLALLGTAVTYIVRSKKRGGHCIGCPSGGNCPHCNGGCNSETK